MPASARSTRFRLVRSLCLFSLILSLSHGFAPVGHRLPTRQTFLPETSLLSTRGQDVNHFQPTNSTTGESLEGADYSGHAQNLLSSEESEEKDSFGWAKRIMNQVQPSGKVFKLPPLQIDDFNVLFYDVFLIINLSVSISFWVVHRLQLEYVALAFNEGCLLSILWVLAGLYHGAFLYSAVDGHVPPSSMEDEKNSSKETTSWWESLSETKAGPSAAGLLALNTFINTISLRLIVALVVAYAEHRPVFDDPLEQLIPLEVGFGLILMSSWRTIHSLFMPRI